MRIKNAASLTVAQASLAALAVRAAPAVPARTLVAFIELGSADCLP